MELFGKASHKVVVDVTAKSAFLPMSSFGYNCISKAARKMAFDTLAKERNDIKV
jgi:short-subunit dehydrogenase involved in D-alanine esterification of teichoic acids